MKRALIASGTAGAFVAGTALASPETREAIVWAWTFALTVVREGPIGLWAVLLAMLLGWLAMAWMRIWLPQCTGPAAERRQLLVWLVGLLVTLGVTYGIWRSPWGIWLGVTLGMAAPWSWEGALLLIGLASPAFAEKLRGVPR